MNRSISRVALLLLITCFSALAGAQDHHKPLVIAHRGGARESTENTIEAFQRAMKIGAAGIETDIRLTRDGVVVVYHDDQYGRVEGLPRDNKSPLVSDLTYAELTAKPLSPVGDDQGGRHPPTLKRLLAEVKGGLLNIELKRCARFDNLVDQTIEQLRGFNERQRVVLEVPDLVTARKVRAALGPEQKIHINPGYDDSVPYEEAMRRVLEFKPHSISVAYQKCSMELTAAAHKAGVQVWVWTVNDGEIAKAMAVLGADAIKTDRPTLLLDLFH